MLKSIIKHIDCELEESEEYIQSAFESKERCPATSELFIMLAAEELGHADRLIKQGQNVADKLSVKTDLDDHHKEKLIIWKYEKEKAQKEITALKIQISSYKSI